MAKSSAVLSVAITADTKKFKKGIDKASSQIDKFSSSVRKASGKVAKGLGIMGGAALGLGAVAGKHLFSVGEELVSLDKKISTVFSGESAATVKDWADEVAGRMGLTSTAAQGLAANAGDLLKPMGATAAEAALMSTQIVGLSGALSEWSAGQFGVEETAEILQKALLGERDSLKALGISINQAEVDQLAMNLAQADGRDAITNMDKALATQQLIMDKSTDAQAAFAEGGNGLTGAQNELKASLGELEEQLARKLLPVFAALAGYVTGTVVPALEKHIPRAIEYIETHVVPIAVEIGQRIVRAFKSIAEFIIYDLMPAVVAVVSTFASFIGWIAGSEETLAGLATFFGITLVGALVLKTIALKAAIVQWWILNGAMAISIAKFLLVAAAVAALVAGVVWAYKNIGWFKTAVDALRDAAVATFDWMKDNVPPIFQAVVDAVTPVVTIMWVLASTWVQIQVKIIKIGVKIVEWFIKLPGKIGDVFADIAGIFTGLVDDALGLGKDIVDAIVEGIKSAPGAIAGAIKDAIPGAGAVGGAVDWVTGGGWKGPFAATGGIVTRPTLALIGEAGPEAVVPLNRTPGSSPLPGGGGGDVHVTVNMPAGSSGDDVVAALQSYVRRRGALPLAIGSARY